VIANPYIVLGKNHFTDGFLVLRAVEKRDIEFIRVWRNAQMDILRQHQLISKSDQERYFLMHVWPEKESVNPGQILLAIELEGNLIGYGGFVHINWDSGRAEVSFLLNPDIEKDTEAVHDYFYRFLNLLKEIAFKKLGLIRLSTETYEHRKLHIHILESVGFRLEGRLRKQARVRGRYVDSLLHGILVAECVENKNQSVKGLRVLLTSASRKLPLLRALKEAAKRISQDAQVIAGDSDPLAISRVDADLFWKMPDIELVNPRELIDECMSRSISVIFPSRDAELVFWAANRQAFSEAGIKVIVSDVGTVRLCRDKLSFAEFGVAQKLPVIPSSLLVNDFLPRRLVVKERFGSGSNGVHLELTVEEALHFSKELKQPIFQPYINGEEISIDAWVGTSGVPGGLVLRKRDRVLFGESVITTTFRDPHLETKATEFISKFNFRGPIVIQAIVSAGELRIIECNPRFGGASTASLAVGLDSLYWSLSEAFDTSFKPKFKRLQSEIRQLRAAQDFIVHDSHF
jgi:RimJ/RimL family protein N-acetyltransferase/predicted ATP-grasp superfamily ATP-dependent carboligase